MSYINRIATALIDSDIAQCPTCHLKPEFSDVYNPYIECKIYQLQCTNCKRFSCSTFNAREKDDSKIIKSLVYDWNHRVCATFAFNNETGLLEQINKEEVHHENL